MKHESLRDRYGFLFWLRWIVWFAGSFVLAALFWTMLMKRIFGPVAGPELTVTWTVSVFGSWFILVIPFMRKKEQIWKRLNDDQEKAVDAWLLGMGLFIGLLVASSFFWSVRLRGPIGEQGLSGGWIKAVLVSWLLVLLPFLVWLYRMADRIFKTAVERQTHAPKFRSVFIDPVRRMLSEPLADRVKAFKPALPDGHLVTAILKDGTRVPHVFIFKGREVLGVYDHDHPFDVREVTDLEPMDPGSLPAYEESLWTRFDG